MSRIIKFFGVFTSYFGASHQPISRTWPHRAHTALVILGTALLFGISPMAILSQEEEGDGDDDIPTSHGWKHGVCDAFGCGDQTALDCVSTEVTITAAIAADFAVLGIEIEIGGTLNVTCYQGLRKD